MVKGAALRSETTLADVERWAVGFNEWMYAMFHQFADVGGEADGTVVGWVERVAFFMDGDDLGLAPYFGCDGPVPAYGKKGAKGGGDGGNGGLEHFSFDVIWAWGFAFR